MKTEGTSDKVATLAEQSANTAPEKPAPKKRASKKNGAPEAKRGAKSKKPAKAAAKKSASDRSNKKAPPI